MKSALKNVGAAVLGLSVSIALAEVALRVAGISYPAFYTVDFHRGYSLRPYAEGYSIREGRGYMRVNADGFRGKSVAPLAQGGTLRVAVLGDSFAEAQQVDEVDSFVDKLRNNLSKEGSCRLTKAYPRGVETLNFGVGGYGTGQELLTWRYLARRYHPDLVVLAVYPGNDFKDNEPVSSDHSPVFRFDQSGALVLDNSFRSSSLYRWRSSVPARLTDALINGSRLLQLLNEAKNRYANPVGPSPSRVKSASRIPPRSVASDQAWQLTDRLIGTLAQEVQASGARLVVISTSSPDQVWPDRRQRPAQPFAQEQRLARLLAARGIPYLPLGPELQRRADAGGLLLHGFPGQAPGEGHWNATGHRLAAELITPWLCQQ